MRSWPLAIRLIAVFIASLVAIGCSLFAEPHVPQEYELTNGPIAAAKRELAAAQAATNPTQESYVQCFVEYAVGHSQAVATATEISEAATVACWPQLDHLRGIHYTARTSAARVAQLERGTQWPADIAGDVDREVRKTEALARGKALDIVVRKRTPNSDRLPASSDVVSPGRSSGT